MLATLLLLVPQVASQQGVVPDCSFGRAVDATATAVITSAWTCTGGAASTGEVFLMDTNLNVVSMVLPPSPQADVSWGADVAISDNYVAISAGAEADGGLSRGAVYVFDSQTLTLVSRCTPNDPVDYNSFGARELLIRGNRVFSSATATGFNSGAVYVHDVATGQQLAKIVAPDAAPGDYFSWSFDEDGGVLVVGAYGKDKGGFSHYGKAYLYDSNTYQYVGAVTSPERGGDILFGMEVAIDGGVVAVTSAWGAEVTLYSAATLGVLSRIVDPNGPVGTNDFCSQCVFGYSMDLDGGLLLVNSLREAEGFIGKYWMYDVSAPARPTRLKDVSVTGGQVNDFLGRTECRLIGKDFYASAGNAGTGAVGVLYRWSL